MYVVCVCVCVCVCVRVCVYKIVDISTETWNKAGFSVIKVHENDYANKIRLLSLRISYTSKRWGGRNIYGKNGVKKINELTKQKIRKFKIDRSILIMGRKESIYVSEVIVIPTIMQTRLSKPETIKFRSDLGFNQIDLILKKEQSVVIPPLKAFSAEKIKLQNKILENERIRTDIYFSENNFIVERKWKTNDNRKTFWLQILSQD